MVLGGLGPQPGMGRELMPLDPPFHVICHRAFLSTALSTSTWSVPFTATCFPSGHCVWAVPRLQCFSPTVAVSVNPRNKSYIYGG